MADINAFRARPPVGSGFAAQLPSGLYGVQYDAPIREVKQGVGIGALAETWPAKLAQALIGAAALPGDVYAGRVDPNSDEAVRKATDLAGMLALGGSMRAMGMKAGEPELGIFGGRLAKTAPLDDLARAEAMEQAGTSADDIWKATGWGRGADGKWRFEIPDNQTTWKIPPKDWISRNDDGVLMAPNVGTAFEKAKADLVPQAPVRVKRIMEHQPLSDAYPAALNTPLRLERGAASGSHTGDSIGVHQSLTPMDAKSTFLHELQHGTQSTEGFAVGGRPDPKMAERLLYEQRKKSMTLSPDVFKQLNPKGSYRSYLSKIDRDAKKYAADETYRRLAGEVEARNVQKRMDMTPAERRATPPWATEDVPRDQQIVRMGGAGPQMSVGEPKGLLGIKAYHGSPQPGKVGGMFDFSNPGGGSRVAQIGKTEITYGVGKDGLVEVILVKTPKTERGQGAARAAMQQMISEADANGLRLALNADPMDKGVSKSGLVQFYKSLGFRRNAGSKRDFSTRAEFIREPVLRR